MYDINLEKTILSHCLGDPSELGKILEILKPTDFYEKSHGDLWDKIGKGYAEGSIDTIKLMKGNHGQLVMDLVREAVFLDDDKSMQICETLKDLSQRRQVHTKCQAMLRECQNYENNFTSILSRFSDSLLDDCASGGSLVPLEKYSLEFVKKVELAAKGEIVGFPTGIQAFDRKFGGLHNGLYVMAGRPGMGKSALAFCIARNGGEQGRTTAVFSMEMEGSELYGRELSYRSGISGDRFLDGSLTKNEHLIWQKKLAEIKKLPIYIDESTSQRISQIKTKCMAFKKSKGLDLVIVDNAQIIGGDNRQSIREIVSQTSRGLKNLSKDLKIPVILISHMSRDIERRESKEPMLADLKESGSLEQDANGVIFLHRPGIYDNGETPLSKGKIILAKMRGHRTGAIWAKFDGPTTNWSDWDDAEDFLA